MKRNQLFSLTIFILSSIILLHNSCTKSSTTVKPPTVVFTVSPNNGTTETTFVFDASESTDGLGNKSDIIIRWDFENDGNWDTEWQSSKTQLYQYSSDGYYTVGMQLQDSYSYVGWTSRSLVVGEGGGGGGPGAPTATFTVTPSEGYIGSDFLFDASEVSDAESPLEDLQVRWDFDGNSTWDADWSNTKTIIHQYTEEGNYNSIMQVKDPEGNTSSISRSVTVSSLVNLNYIFVAGGSFEMGCTTEQGSMCEDDEYPSHSVTVDDFSISKFEITNTQFADFLNAVNCGSDGILNDEQYIHIESDTCQVKHDGSSFYPIINAEERPVIYVTWFGAKAYCQWVGGRLPTEAEWEYAARGGNQSNGYRYSGSNTINSVAWFSDNSDLQNHDIGTKTPNELGIYDMSGNVREWCNDWFDYHYYESSPSDNPQGADDGIYRVLRGGSFWVNAADCRVADRYWGFPENTFYKYEVGFRVVED